MNGKTHGAIGVATGCLICTIGISHGYGLAAVSVLTSGVGAKLPDIDHNSSKIGRTRKTVMNVVKVVGTLTLTGAIALTAYEALRTGSWLKAILTVLLPVLAVVLACIAAKVPAVQKALGFYTKHRGIMHTMVVPVLLIVLTIYRVNIPVIQWALIGLAAGYVSHLIADSLTVSGCPLLWPITKNDMHLLPKVVRVKTGTAAETIVGALIVGGELCLSAIMLLS